MPILYLRAILAAAATAWDPIETPQTSDEFSDASALGQQWEWNHNPDDDNWSLKARPGFLRLKAAYAPNLLHARNTLTQQMQYRDFDLTTRMDVSGMKDGQRAGLVMFGVHPSSIGVVQADGERSLVFTDSAGDVKIAPLRDKTVQLRMHVEDGSVRYSYSLDDGRTFQPAGPANPFA